MEKIRTLKWDGKRLVDADTGEPASEKSVEAVEPRKSGEAVAYCAARGEVLPIDGRPNWWEERGDVVQGGDRMGRRMAERGKNNRRKAATRRGGLW